MKFKIEGKEIKLDIGDFMYELHDKMDEDAQLDMINTLGWFDVVIEKAVDLLAEEYSRPNYNTNIHKYREDLLIKVKQEEIKYYASKIASLLESNRKWENMYWKMYHHHQDTCRRLDEKCNRDFPLPKHEPIDFDGKREAEKVIDNFLAEEVKTAQSERLQGL